MVGKDTKQTRRLLSLLSVQITKDLRCYGDIVINFDYVQKTARQKLVNNQIMYYYAERPDILISVVNSFPRIYRYLGDQIELIPEGMFNVDYLKGLVQA